MFVVENYKNHNNYFITERCEIEIWRDISCMTLCQLCIDISNIKHRMRHRCKMCVTVIDIKCASQI